MLDLGVHWDPGAPVPHVLTNGDRATVVCYTGQPDPEWDGTYVTVVSPRDDRDDLWAVIELRYCLSIRVGPPNDELIGNHPLGGRGLRAYEAHEVHNSTLIGETVHGSSLNQRDYRRARDPHHFILAFHDEMVEAVATGIEAHTVRGSFRDILARSVDSVIDQPFSDPPGAT